MSEDKKAALKARMATLKRQRDDLELELRVIEEAEERAVLEGFAGLPRDLTELCKLYQKGGLTKKAVDTMWHKLWYQKDAITLGGRQVCDILDGLMSDVEDCNCQIFLDLSECKFYGPYEYGKKKVEAQAKLVSEREQVICVFAK